jgi:hypothetical protein
MFEVLICNFKFVIDYVFTKFNENNLILNELIKNRLLNLIIM